MNALTNDEAEKIEKLRRRPERRLHFRVAWRLGFPHPNHLLSVLDARQLAEVYAFARIDPLDEPLQKMLAELTSVLAKAHGNDLGVDEFILVRKPPDRVDDRAVRSQQITQMFARASKRNGKVN